MAAAKIQRPGLVPFLSTKESKPLWMADNSCRYDSLRAACLRWMTNGKAQSHQWSLDILLYCCTRFPKQVKTRWQRTRSTLFHVQCFLIETTWRFFCRDLAAAWMIGPGEATRTGSTSPLCGVTRLAEIWRIFAASFHLHFLCKARYDRLMRSAIVIQSGGIMGMIQEDMPKRWRLGIGSREEEWLETIILKKCMFFFLNDIRTSTFPALPPPQCEWRWLAGNMIDGSSFVGLAEPRPFSGRREGAWRGYTRKSQKKTCWYCVPKDLLCINCICMYGWTKTVAETHPSIEISSLFPIWCC